MAAVPAHAHCTPIKRDSQCRDDNVNEDDGDGDDCTVVSHVGGRPFWMKNFKCIFLVSLASLDAERSGKIDFRTQEAQKTEKMLSQMGSYVHFTV